MGLFANSLRDVEGNSYTELMAAMIDCIENEKVKQFVKDIVVKTGRMETYKKPASSGGKYHPEISNGDWGLLNHTALALLALDTFELFYANSGMLDPDVCKAAIILHDAWKYESLTGSITPFTTKEHGFVGGKRIAEFANDYPTDDDTKVILDNVAYAVRYHMSHWCHRTEDVEHVKKHANLNERVVMICDFLASNKALHNFRKFQ
jgi:23S rRNA maturation-related 3'-5' exoribonuclease YhaM